MKKSATCSPENLAILFIHDFPFSPTPVHLLGYVESPVKRIRVCLGLTCVDANKNPHPQALKVVIVVSITISLP